MGLDIISVLKYEQTDDDEDSYTIDNGDYFNDRLCDLKRGDRIRIVETGECFRMSYMGYGYFREWLAELAGYPKKETPKPHYSDVNYEGKLYYHTKPHINGMYNSGFKLEDDFAAIIHFSDCEGFIGNRLCKVLKDSLLKHYDKAQHYEYYTEKYNELLACVTDAADSGGFLMFAYNR